jgi:hypothetical protein
MFSKALPRSPYQPTTATEDESLSTPNFSALLARHRAYFRTGATRSAQWREGQLTALKAMMTKQREE